jgi:hypothetical protein
MEAIRQGLDGPGGYANGLYWFVRSADTPSPAVESLIEGARAKGISAHLIRYESFDDLFGRLLTPYVLPAHLDEVLKKAQPQPRLSPFAVPARSAGGFPVLRLNALLLESYPTTARRIGVSGIGGTREVKDAIVAAGVDAIAHRRHDGIVAFGADAALRTAFASFSPTDWDQAPLDPLAGPPTDVGLLYDAIVRAIARRSPFLIPQSRVLAVDPSQQDEGALAELRAAAGGLAGTIPKTTLGWFEAVELRLEARFNALWLIFQPTVWADREADTAERYVRGDFIRERLAGRHNRVSYPFVAAWAEILSAGVAECSAFGLAAGTGFDATFKIDATTAYARRGA